MPAVLEPVVDNRKPVVNPEVGNTVTLIMEAHRRRNFHMGMRIKLWNSLSAQLRRAAGHNTHMEGEQADKDREATKKVAQDAMTILDKVTDEFCKSGGDEDPSWFGKRLRAVSKDTSKEAIKLATDWWEDALRTKQALKAMEPTEKAYEKAMLKYAKNLPKHVLEWVESERCRGFGLMSLAAIIAEAGDLSNYDNPAKLWKRLGVAVIDGCAQGHPKGFWKDAEGVEHGRKPTAEEWIEHGYCKKRRSILWNVGTCLIKASGWYKKNVYDKHKEADRKNHPAPTKDQLKEDAKAGRRTPYTDIHLHRRAQRYMEKLLVKDLWNVWCFGGTSKGWVVTPEKILMEGISKT